MSDKVTAIILARGGSKGIPNKNTLDFVGKPLVAWSVIQAKLTKEIDDVYISSDSDKISYLAPAIGGLTVGVSYMDGGTAGDTDSTSFGGRYQLGDNVTIGYTNGQQEVSGAIDNESQNIGVKIALGDVTVIGAMSKVEGADEDIDTVGAGASYKLNGDMTIAVSTMESEDALDVSGTEKENLKQHMAEVSYAIAPGLTGYVNYTDYEYKNGGEASTDDDGSVVQFKIAAKI